MGLLVTSHEYWPHFYSIVGSCRPLSNFLLLEDSVCDSSLLVSRICFWLWCHPSQWCSWTRGMNSNASICGFFPVDFVLVFPKQAKRRRELLTFSVFLVSTRGVCHFPYWGHCTLLFYLHLCHGVFTFGRHCPKTLIGLKAALSQEVYTLSTPSLRSV